MMQVGLVRRPSAPGHVQERRDIRSFGCKVVAAIAKSNVSRSAGLLSRSLREATGAPGRMKLRTRMSLKSLSELI